MGGVPSRSRGSEVQQHVINVAFPDGMLEVPSELRALGGKSSAALATSVQGELIRATEMLAAGIPTDKVPWLLHVLVGDGVASNDAAARRLWAWPRGDGALSRFTYMLAVYKCASHQANLAAKGCVLGSTAVAAQAQ